MTKHKFVQIELTSTEHNDNLINNMLSNFSEELSKMQEAIVIEHLKTFIGTWLLFVVSVMYGILRRGIS